MALPRANALSDRRGSRDPVALVASVGAQQPVVNVPLYSTGAAIRLTALLLGHILPVFALATSNQPAHGRSRCDVRRGAKQRERVAKGKRAPHEQNEDSGHNRATHE